MSGQQWGDRGEATGKTLIDLVFVFLTDRNVAICVRGPSTFYRPWRSWLSMSCHHRVWDFMDCCVWDWISGAWCIPVIFECNIRKFILGFDWVKRLCCLSTRTKSVFFFLCFYYAWHIVKAFVQKHMYVILSVGRDLNRNCAKTSNAWLSI